MIITYMLPTRRVTCCECLTITQYPHQNPDINISATIAKARPARDGKKFAIVRRAHNSRTAGLHSPAGGLITRRLPAAAEQLMGFELFGDG